MYPIVTPWCSHSKILLANSLWAPFSQKAGTPLYGDTVFTWSMAVAGSPAGSGAGFWLSRGKPGLGFPYGSASGVVTRPGWSDGQRPDAVRADGLGATRCESSGGNRPRARTLLILPDKIRAGLLIVGSTW